MSDIPLIWHILQVEIFKCQNLIENVNRSLKLLASSERRWRGRSSCREGASGPQHCGSLTTCISGLLFHLYSSLRNSLYYFQMVTIQFISCVFPSIFTTLLLSDLKKYDPEIMKKMHIEKTTTNKQVLDNLHLYSCT